MYSTPVPSCIILQAELSLPPMLLPHSSWLLTFFYSHVLLQPLIALQAELPAPVLLTADLLVGWQPGGVWGAGADPEIILRAIEANVGSDRQ